MWNKSGCCKFSLLIVILIDKWFPPSILTPPHPEYSKINHDTHFKLEFVPRPPAINRLPLHHLSCLTITVPLKANMQFNYFVKVWKPLFHINFTRKPYYEYTILTLSDSHFAHGRFRNCTAQSKNSHSVRQFRNSHFVQSDSKIVQILTLRRTYIWICLQGLMKFEPRLFKILRKQNFMDRGTYGHTDGQRENSIPFTNKVCGRGYNYFVGTVP